MFELEDRRTLNEIAVDISAFRANTADRDQASADREREMLSDLDALTAAVKSVEDGKASSAEVKELSAKLTRVRERLADKLNTTHTTT